MLGRGVFCSHSRPAGNDNAPTTILHRGSTQLRNIVDGDESTEQTIVSVGNLVAEDSTMEFISINSIHNDERWE